MVRPVRRVRKGILEIKVQLDILDIRDIRVPPVKGLHGLDILDIRDIRVPLGSRELDTLDSRVQLELLVQLDSQVLWARRLTPEQPDLLDRLVLDIRVHLADRVHRVIKESEESEE